MRRHYANYFKGIENFKEYRMKMVTAGTFDEIMEILDDISNNPRYANLELEAGY